MCYQSMVEIPLHNYCVCSYTTGVCEMAKTYIHKEVAKTVTMFYDANVELYEPLLKFKITMLG